MPANDNHSETVERFSGLDRLTRSQLLTLATLMMTAAALMLVPLIYLTLLDGL